MAFHLRIYQSVLVYTNSSDKRDTEAGRQAEGLFEGIIGLNANFVQYPESSQLGYPMVTKALRLSIGFSLSQSSLLDFEETTVYKIIYSGFWKAKKRLLSH